MTRPGAGSSAPARPSLGSSGVLGRGLVSSDREPAVDETLSVEGVAGPTPATLSSSGACVGIVSRPRRDPGSGAAAGPVGTGPSGMRGGYRAFAPASARTGALSPL